MKKNRTIDWNIAESAGENARRSLPRMAQEFFALGRTAVGPASTAVQLHGFRLSAKRFRYTLELFEPMYGPMFSARLEKVRKIQSLLGDRQDCVVLAERLTKRVGEAGSLRPVLAKLHAEGHALEDKFRRFWRETFDAPGEEALWTRYLGRRPAEPRAHEGASPKAAAAHRASSGAENIPQRA